MKFQKLSIPDVVVISPHRIQDARGFFMETFRQDLFETAIAPIQFVQENHSLSAQQSTIRGLHFQVEPRAQGKLVRCVAGAIWDVVVDMRASSRTFRQHVSVELSAENGQQLWVPPGFAHGFCTMVPNAEVCYKVTEYYSAEHDRGIAFDDPDLDIAWPVNLDEAILSMKDKQHPRLSVAGAPFA
ncbi:dTDP-4-dehydrorhamnose 3,5-epimerase [Neorhizobium sp. DT-125]|uniref:dTDP-4-dehydrorhamnose 3,5-epimerase n=1 Tax=Neorhizobium sp. DT-125 TaxID=3396163 RepID=UPI003F1BC64E